MVVHSLVVSTYLGRGMVHQGVIGLSSSRLGFNSMPVHVGFLMDQCSVFTFHIILAREAFLCEEPLSPSFSTIGSLVVFPVFPLCNTNACTYHRSVGIEILYLLLDKAVDLHRVGTVS